MDEQQLPKIDPPSRPRLRIELDDLPPASGQPAASRPTLPPVEPGRLWSAAPSSTPTPMAALPAPPTAAKPTVMPTAVCHNCGGTLDARAVACPHCGLPTATAYAGQAAAAVIGVNRKSSGVALLLSLLWPGAGQIYVGRFGAGAAFMIASFLAALLVLVLIGIFIYVPLLIWAMIDAYKAAEEHNRRLLRGGYV